MLGRYTWQNEEPVRSVITEGNGKTLFKNSLYTVAGKTGTAQIANGREVMEIASRSTVRKTYQASFCGYFPAKNPKYSMIVVINHPTKGSYLAAKVAGPVFKKLRQGICCDQSNNQAKPMHFVGNTNLPQVKKEM